MFTECEYADKGCNIYSVRPQSCRDCLCAWITQPKGTVELRPDQCGMIFTRKGKIMVGTLIGKLTPAAIKQMDEFKEQGFHVIVQKEY